MSVLIKDMAMPDYGYICLKLFANGDVLMTKEHRGALVITGINERVGTAVLVPKHGRLIDLDALYREAERRMREEESMTDAEISLHMDILRFCFEKDGSRLYAPVVIDSEEQDAKE